MIKILLNYDHTLYPYTTASYLQMAILRRKDTELLFMSDLKDKTPDLIINVQPFRDILIKEGVPSCYWEIDAHLAQGNNKDYYEKVDKVYIAQNPYKIMYPFGKTEYLPLACDPTVHHFIAPQSGLYDIGFIGNDTYPARRQLLDILCANFKVLRTNTEPGIPYSTAFSTCKLIFNRSMLQDINMRFFEAIAIGRLLLTDYLPDQDALATEGKHYVAYEDSKDLIKKVQYYLSQENEREYIASEGADHMKEYHTYDKRLEYILDDFGLK